MQLVEDKFESRDIYRCYFTPDPHNNHQHICQACPDGRSLKQQLSKGYQNLLSHVKMKHEDYMERVKMFLDQEARSNEESISRYFLRSIPDKVQDAFKWIEWIVMCDLPLSFIEDKYSRRNSRLRDISVKSLKKYMNKLSDKVEEQIRNSIPKKFGIIFDGWTADGTGYHYVAMFLSYTTAKGNVKQPLLAISPLIEEGDFSAESHRILIDVTLSRFDRELSDITFLCGDNCSTNKKLARLLNVPLVGCAAHRLNLACQKYYSGKKDLIDKVDNLVKSLKTLTNSAQLRKVTDLVPLRRNVTRWTSTFKMLDRFVEIQPFIMEANLDIDVLSKIPNAAEFMEIKELLKNLKKLHDVTLELQKSDTEVINLYTVRALFDGIIEEYPEMVDYLGPYSHIVANKDFENGVVKIIGGQEDTLTIDEKEELKAFRKDVIEIDDETVNADTENNNFAADIIEKAVKKRRIELQLRDDYVSLKHISATSVAVERLFSSAKLICSDHRKSLSPRQLEMLLFLKANRDLWDLNLFSTCV